MAHPYGSQSQLETLLGRELVNKLLQLEGSNATTVYSRAREDADAWLDAKLAQAYVVPFAAYNDVTPTPPIVNTLSNYRAAVNILATRFPLSAKLKHYQAELKEMLKDLLSGDAEIPSATKVAANAGRTGIKYEARDTEFGMERDTDTADEGLSDRTGGVF